MLCHFLPTLDSICWCWRCLNNAAAAAADGHDDDDDHVNFYALSLVYFKVSQKTSFSISVILLFCNPKKVRAFLQDKIWISPRLIYVTLCPKVYIPWKGLHTRRVHTALGCLRMAFREPTPRLWCPEHGPQANQEPQAGGGCAFWDPILLGSRRRVARWPPRSSTKEIRWKQFIF